jgi:hypothetical protein
MVIPVHLNLRPSLTKVGLAVWLGAIDPQKSRWEETIYEKVHQA